MLSWALMVGEGDGRRSSHDGFVHPLPFGDPPTLPVNTMVGEKADFPKFEQSRQAPGPGFWLLEGFGSGHGRTWADCPGLSGPTCSSTRS